MWLERRCSHIATSAFAISNSPSFGADNRRYSSVAAPKHLLPLPCRSGPVELTPRVRTAIASRTATSGAPSPHRAVDATSAAHLRRTPVSRGPRATPGRVPTPCTRADERRHAERSHPRRHTRTSYSAAASAPASSPAPPGGPASERSPKDPAPGRSAPGGPHRAAPLATVAVTRSRSTGSGPISAGQCSASVLRRRSVEQVVRVRR